MPVLASLKRKFIKPISRAKSPWSLLFTPVFSLRVRARVGVALLLLIVAFSGIAINLAKPGQTAAATNNVINFQARLETSAGAIVPDGNYNVQFKLYNVSTGGTALWTESYLNSASQGIQVVNGYLTANLGSITAFPSTINWDQQLYLTMNIGGTTTGTPSYDGEMNPRLQLTALPYAFRAGKLSDPANSGSTLGWATQSTANSILLPDEGGTLCIESSTNCGFATSTGSTSYIQNGTSVQTGANFNIDGNGTIGGTLQAATVNATSTLELGGTDINTAGILTNVAYLNQANTFTNTNKVKTTSSTAFQVDNSGGTNYLTINTSSGAFNIGNTSSGPYVQATCGIPVCKVHIGDGVGDTINLDSATGSGIDVGSGTFSITSSNISVAQTGYLNVIGGYEISGANINTGGTLSNVAYLDQANTFSQAQSVNTTGGATSIQNTVSGSGLVLAGAGPTTTGILRVVSNTGAWADSQTTAYYQVDTGSGTHNATFMSGGYGTDTQFNRLQFNSDHTTVSGYNFTATPVPTATLEVANATSTQVAQKIIGASGQSADLLQLQAYGGSTPLASFDSSGDLTVQGNITLNGSQFTNAGATLNSADSLSNFASGGSIGTAATTVDKYTSFAIDQTTTGQTLSLPSPTDTTAGRVVYVFNTGTADFDMESVTIQHGYGQIYMWNGSGWILGASGGGSANTLQSAYDGGNTITTSNARDLSVTLANTTTDSNFIINVASGSTGQFEVQNNGSNVLAAGASGVAITTASANALQVTDGTTNYFNLDTASGSGNGTFNLGNTTSQAYIKSGRGSVLGTPYWTLQLGDNQGSSITLDGVDGNNSWVSSSSGISLDASGGALSLQGTSASLDTTGSGTVSIGTTHATGVTIGRTGQTVTMPGDLSVTGTGSIGSDLTVGGSVVLQETTAPSATTGYGKVYVNSSDSNLYYKDGGGTTYDLTAGAGVSQFSNLFYAYDAAGNISLTSGWTDLTLDTEVRKDSNFTHASDAAAVTLNAAGWYQIDYDVSTYFTSGSNRTSSEAKVQEDTGSGWTDIPGSLTEMYNRIAANSANTGSGSVLWHFNAGDQIKLVGEAYGGTDPVETMPNGVRLNIRRVVDSGSVTGTGAVNSGTAGDLAFYGSTGTTVQDATGLSWDSGSSILGVTGTVDASSDVNVGGTLNLNGGSSSIQILNQSTAGHAFLKAAVSGEPNTRFIIYTNGKITWGPGTSAADTSLQRASAGGLEVNNSFTVDTNLNVGSSSQFQVDSSGNVSTSGTYNTNTFTSSALQFAASSAATIDSASGQDLQIASAASNKTIQIGNNTSTGATQTINLGYNASAGTLNTQLTNINIGTASNSNATTTIQAGYANGSIQIGSLNSGATQTINIGTNTAAVQTVKVGSAYSTSSTTLQAGSGGINLNSSTISTNATTSSLLNTTATTINFGGAVGSGGLNLAGGSSSTGCSLDGSTGNFTCSGTVVGSNTSLQGAYNGGQSITLNSGPVTLAATGSGASGLNLTAIGYYNSPFINWDNGTSMFSIRSDDNALRLGVSESDGAGAFDNNFNLYSDGSITLQNTTDSTTAFQVLSHGNNTILGVSTSSTSDSAGNTFNGAVNTAGYLFNNASGVGMTFNENNTHGYNFEQYGGAGNDLMAWINDFHSGFNNTLEVNSNSNSSSYPTLTVNGYGSQTQPLIKATDGGGNTVFNVARTGDTTIATSTNSTTAFQVQNSSGTSLLTGDTSGMNVNVNGTLNVQSLAAAGGSAPTVIGGSSTSSSGATSKTISTNSSTQAGDLVIITGYVEPYHEASSTATYGTFSLPAGVSLAPGFPINTDDSTITSTYTHRLYVWYYYATASGSQNLTFTNTSSVYWGLASSTIRGGPTAGNPLADSAATNTISQGATGVTSTPAVSLSLGGVNSLVLWAYGDWGGGNSGYPSGYTDVSHSSNYAGQPAIGQHTYSSAGSTGTVSASRSSSNNGMSAALLSFRAPSGSNILTLKDSSGSNVGVVNSNGDLTLQGTASSTTALLVNNSSGTTILGVDTSNQIVSVSGDLTLNSNADTTMHQLLFRDEAYGAQWRVGDSVSGATPNGLQGGYSQETELYSYWGLLLGGNRQSTGTPSLYADGTHSGADVTVLGSGNANNILQAVNSSGNSAVDLLYDGSRDSGVVKLGGGVTGGYLEFANNNNFKWSIGMDGANACGGTTPSDTLYVYDGAGGCAVQFGYTNGNALFTPASSTTAFQIQNTSGTSLFTVDSSNSRLYVGNPTADSTATLLVLDTKNTTGDPTCVNGGMYYNSNSKQAKICINGGWAAAGVPTVTSLPTSPANGDEVYYRFYSNGRTSGNTEYWHLRYNSSTGYWDFLGGPAMESLDNTTHTTSSSSYVASSSYDYLPLNGDYDISFGSGLMYNNSSGFNQMQLGLYQNSTSLSTCFYMALGLYGGSSESCDYRLTGVTGAGGTSRYVQTDYMSLNGASSTFYPIYTRVTPIRVK